MHAGENCLPVIEIVTTLTQIEIEDVDRIHLLHFVVLVADLDVLRKSFRYTIEHTHYEVKLAS